MRRLALALAAALPWGVGAALGVAAGAYLTAVGGAGAPGAEAIRPGTDLVVLPAVAFAAMVAAHMLARALSGAVRSLMRRKGSPASAAEPPEDGIAG